jgi:prepilin-type N-terminal cleavage/methylation domain-containing protein
MRKITSGFTMVEILVVIAVIGIITTISFMSFGRYQADTRDTQRSAKTTILAEALEKYYDANGEYPSCSALTGSASSVTTTVLPGVESKTLVAPQATSGATNSFSCSDLTNVTTDPDTFSYIGDGSTACTSGSACLEFTLKYKDEATGTIKTISSRRKTTIAVDTISNLVAVPASSTSISLTWSAISNATSYTGERATNSGFTTGVTPFTSSTNSFTSTGLTAGTTYYYHVKAIASTGTSASWSNTASATPTPLATPVITATPNSISQITINWGAIVSATSYTMDYATNSSFTSPTTLTGLTGTSRAVTGLSTGITYYFRLKALNVTDTSNWSATVTSPTIIPAPTGLALTVNSNSQITATWNTDAYSTSYTVQIDDNTGFSSPATATGVATATYARTGLSAGKTYYFRVYALVGTASSAASATANATTTISRPATPTVTATRPGLTRAYSAGYWVVWVSGDATSGNWYYAKGTVSGTSCTGNATLKLSFYGGYNPVMSYSPAQAWSSYTTAKSWYMVQPLSGYGSKFKAKARCDGPDAVSTVSNIGQGCIWRDSGSTSCSGFTF